MAEAALALTLIAALGFSLAPARKGVISRLSVIALGLASLSLIALVVYRSIRISFPALTGTYEGLLVLALGILVFLFVMERRLLSGNRVLLAAGSFAAFVFLAILNSPIIDSSVQPPLPVLRSYWLVVHVAFAFIGLALFTVAMIAGVVGLTGRQRRMGDSPDAGRDDAQGSGADLGVGNGADTRRAPFERGRTDRPDAAVDGDPANRRGAATTAGADIVRDRAIVLGFVCYVTGGLVFGAIWAEGAWGRFWGWDPKETWALVTSVVYAIYLHLRYIRSATPQVARILSIVAWVVAIFTFFGVNYLFQGLHSYG